MCIRDSITAFRTNVKTTFTMVLNLLNLVASEKVLSELRSIHESVTFDSWTFFLSSAKCEASLIWGNIVGHSSTWFNHEGPWNQRHLSHFLNDKERVAASAGLCVPGVRTVIPTWRGGNCLYELDPVTHELFKLRGWTANPMYGNSGIRPTKECHRMIQWISYFLHKFCSNETSEQFQTW